MGKIFARNPDRERLYILKEQREDPREDQVRWYWKLLNSPDYYRAMDNLVEFRGDAAAVGGETRTVVLSGSQERDTLLGGLIRVENLFDEEGAEVLWPATGNRDAKMRFLSTMIPAWRRELAAVITEQNTPTEESRKNSALPSPSPSGGGTSAQPTVGPALASV